MLVLFAIWTGQVIGERELASHQRDQRSAWLRELQWIENTFQHNPPESPELQPAFRRLDRVVTQLSQQTRLDDQAQVLARAGAHLASVLQDSQQRTEARQAVLASAARLQVLIWEEHQALTGDLQAGWNRVLAIASAALIGMATALGLVGVARRRRLQAVALGQRLELALVEAEVARAAAEAASHAKSRFLATVSHEIRTPMTAILGTVEMMGAGALTPRHREQIGVINGSSRALLQLIDDILDLSRIETGRLELAEDEFRIDQLLGQVRSMFDATALARGATLTLGLGPDVPKAVLGDARRVRQVLTNLVGNALKFAAEGEIRLGVQAVPEGLRFSVRDPGPGLAPEQHGRIFDAFTQVDGSSTRVHGGVGLGLAICQELVTAMSGRIGVDSEPGAGSDFWFVLPLAATEASPSQEEDGATQPGALAAALRVLVVDDNQLNRVILGELLQAIGCVPTLVETASRALVLLADDAFDAVLMDCDMPEMDGLEATRRLRQLPGATARVPVIGVSGHVGDQARLSALDAGMDDYLHKPVGLAELRCALDAVVPAVPVALRKPG